MKNKEILIVVLSISFGLILGWFIFSSNSTESNDNKENIEKVETIWTCSMHPQIRHNEFGKCPICAMDLIPLDNENHNEEDHFSLEMSESAMRLANISTEIVGANIPVKSIKLNGKIKIDERLIYSQSSHIPGRIEELKVNFTGEYISEGQVIANIYSPDLVNAQEELLQAFKIKDSQPEMFVSAKEKLKNWKLTDIQIQKIIDNNIINQNFEILSDLSGYVIQKKVNIGDYIKKGESLFEIADLSNVWVLFDVYESDYKWIKVGDKIEFSVESLPGEYFSGKISYLDPLIDSKTRVFNARVEVLNVKNNLKPEMFVSGTVKSKISNNKNSIVIPKSSVLWTGKRSIVYIKNESKGMVSFSLRQIVLGAELGDGYIVEKGLDIGDEIVVNGAFSVDAATQLAGKSSMMNHQELIEDIIDLPEIELKKVSFAVSGNCEMCKENIEKAAKSAIGVKTANWDMKSKTLTVNYNENKTSLDVIHKAISNAGYETDKLKANIDVYNSLPECCQYKNQ